ncbi:nickel-responsive transcriptional regulator NikR [Halorhabdus amylolytica]|uniref:nickel-responsive transcriptional regulator NikR n=1 Tax=Halorhabdus amylolytica TaxID=2559573 RepID=UPI0010AAAF7B|nr:nickel-responsive transcriptional regulator NikR [Halorhabdus amylolytica]
MAEDLDRVSLTLPPDMTDQLDGIVEDWEYASRSEAVRDALRDFFTTYEWERGDETRHYGTIVIAHEHDHESDVAGRLQTIQHEYADVVTSVQHIHLSEDRCMETLVVGGTAGEIDELANRLRAIGGVKQVKVVVVGGAETEHSHSHDQEHAHEHDQDHSHERTATGE